MIDFNSFSIRKKQANTKTEIVLETPMETPMEVVQPESPVPTLHAGPYMPPSLQWIKHKLDRRSNSVQNFDGDDIAAMSYENFEEICTAFEQYFNEEFFCKQSQEEIEKQFTNKDMMITKEKEAAIFGLQKKSTTLHQLNAVWLYMAFSLYTHKQATRDITTAGNEKLNKINELDAAVYTKLGQVIQGINGTKTQFIKKYPLDFHQKLPMIHNNLFHYFQILRNNPRINQQVLLENLPLSFSSEVLSSSCDKMKTRKAAEQSKSESRNNSLLYRSFNENCPQVFEPLAKQNGMYIDDAIGLELDYPHTMKLTFETDGPHHYYPNGRHDFVHSLKSVALRETGWTRVALKTDFHQSSTNADFMTRVLNISNVASFADTYQNLGQVLKDLRTKIVAYQASFQVFNFQEKPLVMNAIMDLLDLENALRKNFLNSKHLKNLLKSSENHKTHEISLTKGKLLQNTRIMQDAKHAIDEFVKKQTAINEEIQSMKELRHAAENDLASLESKYEQMNKGILKYTNILENIKEHPTVTEQDIVTFKNYLKETQAALTRIENAITNKEDDITELSHNLSELEGTLKNSVFEQLESPEFLPNSEVVIPSEARDLILN